MNNRQLPSNPEVLFDLYRTMLRIRRTEQRLATLFADSEVPGFIHLSIGQEAVAAGVASALGPTDTVASNHRGHGHAIAKGMSLGKFFLEVMGKRDGVCGGRAGSMHVADMSVGMLGANGIVGAGMSLALGSAMAFQIRRTLNVAAVFFGDGAIAEGLLHESMNLAALWRLPLLFVCENNGWAEFTPSSKQVVVKLDIFAAAYGVPYRCVDGNDVETVSAAAAEIVQSLRGGTGPAFLECKTQRVRGHYEGDAQKYRDAQDAASEALDPLVICAKRLRAQGAADALIAALDSDVSTEIETAVALARGAAEADFEAAQRGVYTMAAS